MVSRIQERNNNIIWTWPFRSFFPYTLIQMYCPPQKHTALPGIPDILRWVLL